MEHYCTNKPSFSVSPLGLFKIFKEADRKIIDGHAILNGSNAWDAFLFKTWYGLITDKLTPAEQKELDRFIVAAKAQLLLTTGWNQSGYTEKYALAHRVTDILEIAIKSNSKVIHNHYMTYTEQLDFLEYLRGQIDPNNATALMLVDGKLIHARRGKELAEQAMGENNSIQVEHSAIIAKLEQTDQEEETLLPGDFTMMIDRQVQKFLLPRITEAKDNDGGNEDLKVG
jgi:hypothetical protein